MNPRLATRPLDPKRKVPVPFAQVVTPDGLADFRSLDGVKVTQCAEEGLCGLCGQILLDRQTRLLAFIGGQISAGSRHYSDPPMHVECAEDAMTLCPHIARPLVARREANPASSTPEGTTQEKPKRWVMLVTDSYKWKMVDHQTGDGRVMVAPQFIAGDPEQRRVWVYRDGLAVELKR